jgi:hypothetical protein
MRTKRVLTNFSIEYGKINAFNLSGESPEKLSPTHRLV